MSNRFLPLAALLLAACPAPTPPSITPLDAARDVPSDLAAPAAPSDLAAPVVPSDLAVRTCPPVEVGLAFRSFVAALGPAMQKIAPSGSNALAVPDAPTRDDFARAVIAALDGDARAACDLPPPYSLLHATDPTAGDVLVVAEVDNMGMPAPQRLWGTYAALQKPSAAPARALVFEAPHPIFDSNTENQTAAVFAAARGRYLLIAGSHRCTDDAPSPCDGTTTACGGARGPYRISDAAHAITLPFFTIHARLSMAHPDMTFIQLHGNAASCPDALVSDSSGIWTANSPAGQMAAALEQAGATIGRCGTGGGYPTQGCDLCGGDNVQARFTAGAADACTGRGTTYGRFIHIEQLAGLRAAPAGNKRGWQPMIDAVLAVFPAN